MVATVAAWLPTEGDGMDQPTDPLARQLARSYVLWMWLIPLVTRGITV
jgi:hypothetical protein